MRSPPARCWLTAGAILLSGCAAGPDFAPQAPPVATAYTPSPLPERTVDAGTAGQAQRLVVGGAVVERWWTLFRCPALDALEAQALAGNADTQAAEATLRASRELYLAQRAARYPTVQLAFSGQAARTPASLAPILNSGSADYTLFTVGPNISYVFDLFGGVKRATEAAAAQAESQRYLTAGIYLTLTANVAGAVVQLASLNTQLDRAGEVVETDRRTLEILRRQRRVGESSTLDVANAEVALEQAEQLGPPLRKQIDQTRDLLAALLGHSPSLAGAEAATLRLADLTLPDELPVSLPSDLVRQRPDVLAAEAAIHVASAQVGVAQAARLPSFLITAGPGATATGIGGLFDSGNLFYAVTGGVTQTVFDAGALKHRKRAADAQLDQAKAQYRGVVTTALQSTADSLQAIVDDAETLRHAAAAVGASEKTLALARSQLSAGQAGALAVLTAEAADRQAAIILTQAQASRYADTVTLYQALGGGWTARP